MNDTMYKIVRSWADKKGNVNTTDEIRKWVAELNKTVAVNIGKIALSDSPLWFYDEQTGEIANKSKSFFRIKGLVKKKNGQIVVQQPTIIQDEIGYLGIICKKIDGVMNFLMQAKIEPGNVNKIQLSPTIQATKSNFTQKHGGGKPAYLDYFVNAKDSEIVVDQIQSEQSSRFYKKRNRNIIINVSDDIVVLPTHKWMTLGQIKHLMRTDNLVNMDTRTVLSCLPFSMCSFTNEQLNAIEERFPISNHALFRSVFCKSEKNILPEIYQEINNYKMFDETEISLVDLYSLSNWHMRKNEFVCDTPYDFKVVFCDIAIEGREVKQWTQPLFEAVGMAIFGLILCDFDGVMKFLVKLKPEMGCFDKAELGPSVQLEPMAKPDGGIVTELFFEKWKAKQGIYHDVILSEEGGRFYQEQNHNVVLEIQKEELKNLPQDYFWADYHTLNTLVQMNNCLNIQLRNLLSLLEVSYE